MITTNVIRRVFKFMNNGLTGIIFTLEIDKKQYIITAKHLVKDITNSSIAEIYFEKQWKEINLSLVGHSPADIDISVLATDIQLTPPKLPCEPSTKEIIFGQDVYFLGFPFDIIPDGGPMNRGYPFPFVKKAILSAILVKNDHEVLYLDGHNNPGFSGGPVVYKSPNNYRFRICGVVSGYRFQEQPGFESGSPINIYFRENTGIIISHGINSAIDIIHNNPIGFQLED